jgi:hypothetical protein
VKRNRLCLCHAVDIDAKCEGLSDHRGMPGPICEGAREPGWLCEDHPSLPWEQASCGGAGVRYSCNPIGTVN